MPLSDEEQRLLDEMERNLYKNEADIVQTRSGPRTVNYTRVAIGLVMLVAGLAAIVIGASTQLIIVGIAGFGLAVAGALVALSSSKAAPAEQAPRAGRPAGAPRPGGAKSSLMDRLNEEWDKRAHD